MEGPYELPRGWRWVRLGDAAKREARFVKPADRPAERFRFLGMEQVSPGQWSDPQPVEVTGRDLRSQVVEFRPGLVLYGKLRPYLNKVVVPRCYGVASTEFVPIAPDTALLDADYLGAFLRTPHFVEYATRNTTGSRQPRLRMDALWDALIPLPPLEEQHRIVARIEDLLGRVNEAKQLREEAINEADRLWKSILAETFPQPGSELPPDWQWVKLEQVFRLRNGKFIRKKDLVPDGAVRVYGSSGLLGYTDSREPFVLVDTIAIGRVGACGVVNWVEAPAWISDNAMWVAEWLIPCDPRFVLWGLRSRDLGALAKVGAQPSISQREVYSVDFPLPPASEQQRLVQDLERALEEVSALAAGQKTLEAGLEKMESAILSAAFKGEL